MTQPYQTYQRVAVSTADPLRIVVLLYEGAIKNLNQAAGLFERDIESASTRITRTLEILNYLRSALDYEKGGELADTLRQLYEYMRDVLAQANIQRDVDRVQEVIGLLQTLLEGWRGITSPTTQSDAEEVAPPAAALAAPPAKSVSMFVG